MFTTDTGVRWTHYEKKFACSGENRILTPNSLVEHFPILKIKGASLNLLGFLQHSA